jgi:uncharacterized protein
MIGLARPSKIGDGTLHSNANTFVPLSSGQFAIAFLISATGSVIQGSVGFGMAVLTAPVMLLVNPVFVPVPVMFAGMLQVTVMAVRERRSAAKIDVSYGVAGYVVGSLPGLYVLGALPTTVYQLLFAGLVLTGILLSLAGWRLPPTPTNVAAAGMLTGFAATVSSIGGPFMGLVYQHECGPRIRGTLSAIFTLGTMVAIIGLWWSGRFGVAEFLLSMWLMPGILLGFFVSRFTTPYVDRAHTRVIVLAISGFAAVAVLIRALC